MPSPANSGGLRAPTAAGTVARTTEAQYRALRYWAGNTADRPDRGADPRPWPDRAGLPAPRLQFATIDILTAHGWWIMTPRGWVVTDLGRQAIRMPPLYRDRRCPLTGCAARPGERCREATTDGLLYREAAHDARLADSPALRALIAQERDRRAAPVTAPAGAPAGRTRPPRPPAPPRPPGMPGRWAGGEPLRPGARIPHVAPEAVVRALRTHLPHLDARLRDPIEPRHVGWIVST